MGILERVAAKPERLVIGVASSGSASDVQVALLKLGGTGLSLSWTLLAHDRLEYSFKVRDLILRCSEPGGGDAALICRLNVLLGELYARAATHIAGRAGMGIGEIDLIGAHGQTLQHLPAPVALTGIAVRSSLQVGEPAVVAERTGVTTVGGFSARDLAAGGQGSPLVSYVDYLMFRHRARGRLVLSLGSLASLTAIPASAEPDGVIGFDIGPGSMIMDDLVADMTGGSEPHDAEGRYARRGTVLPGLLARLLEHPFLQQRPPRSCGREEFGRHFLKEILGEHPRASREDLLSTLTRFTAESIAGACRRYVMPHNVYEEAVVSGTGVLNPFLMEQVRGAIPELALTESGEYGLPVAAKEAACYAILANDSILGTPNSLPAVTGAGRPVVLGSITPGLTNPPAAPR
jgi:anhydro-N-acetylmuramic acid kinase